MKYYVAGFMFSPDLENVILIEKQKPEWQKGKYNAIGGKIEKDEAPIDAMVREFMEEAFIKTNKEDWKPVCIIGDHNYEVAFFYCTNNNWRDYMSKTDEEVFHVPVMDLHEIRHKMIQNLHWLIPLCIDMANNFSGKIDTMHTYPLLVRHQSL